MQTAYRTWVVVLAVAALMGCSRQQRTADDADSEAQSGLAEIYTAQQIAIDAENEVIAYVKADSAGWVQHEFGWWFRYTHKSDEHVEYSLLPPADTVPHTIHEVVCDLRGTLLVDAIREYEERDAEPFAYCITMRELTPGDTIEMLLPWFTGYGAKGTEYVPAHTNLRVQLCLHTETCQDL